jgi:hypothetical protein
VKTRHRVFGSLDLALVAAWLGLCAPSALAGEALSVRAAVEKQDVYVGEPFQFQIQVEGSDAPGNPDLSPIVDFAVESLGGRQNNSESFMIINGRVNQTVRRGYVFAYRLTPKRAGTFTLPGIELTIEGKTLRAAPVPIRVREPEETEDLKLRLGLSQPACYVGEPVVLTVSWYFSRDIRSIQFAVPILKDPAVAVADPEAGPAKDLLRVPVGDGVALAVKGEGPLDGKPYTTLTFRKVIIPKRAGAIEIPKATAACEAMTGQRRSRSPIDDFFNDDFFGRGRGLYRSFVVPSNALTLHVRPLPEEGRPADFAGYVGDYRIEAEAAPREVNVGDPITLTVRVSGSPYLKHVDLPPLQSQAALARDFKIPAERSEGKIEGGVKTFVQTLRATHAGVARIPPIELPVFDTKTGRYRVARSEPIPLKVHPTKVITAHDAVGRGGAPVQSELEALPEGIAHNYEDLGVLENQAYGLATAFGDPAWLAGSTLPCAAYLFLLVFTTLLRRRRADPAAFAARRAYRDIVAALKALRAAGRDTPDLSGAVLYAIRDYLGRKLRVPGAALTWRDVEGPLRERGVGPEPLDALQKLFAECEAGRYTGGAAAAPETTTLPDRALRVAKDIERSLA